MTTTPSKAFIALADDGKTYDALGTRTTLRARGQDTGVRCEVIESVFPPQGGLPPHVHHTADEALYVVSGEVEIKVGERAATAPAGSFIFIPRGTPHHFHNASAQPCTLLVTYLPMLGPGIAGFLEEVDRLPPGPPEMEKLGPIMQKYDLNPA